MSTYIGSNYRDMVKGETRTTYEFGEEKATTIEMVPTALLKSIHGPTHTQIDAPKTDLALLKILETDIEDHFEVRIQLFVQQMLLVYNTQRYFLEVKADMQVGKPGKSDDKGGKYACAHPSTIPCIVAVDEEGVIAFGRHSYFNHTWNATDYLPESVNKADSALDFQTKIGELTFRDRCISTINLVASNSITPKTGLEFFLKDAKKYLSAIPQRKGDEERSYSVNKYKSVVKDYRKRLAKGNDFFFFKTGFAKAKDAKYFDKNMSFTDEKGFFRKIHNRMMRVFIKEMEALKPPALSKALKDSLDKPIKQAKKLENLIVESRQQLNESLGDTAEGYASIGAVDQEICGLAKQYLRKIDPKDLVKDLTALRKKKYGGALLEIKTKLLNLLQTEKNKTPSKIELIMHRLLERCAVTV
jgi:hypothetical protein